MVNSYFSVSAPTRVKRSTTCVAAVEPGRPCPPRRIRDATVGRIDDERRPAVRGDLVAALVPEVVVGEHAALRSRRIPGARLPLLRIEQIAVQACVLAGFERGRFRG